MDSTDGAAPHEMPPSVRDLFWDFTPGTIWLERHREFVLERVLSHGTWDATCWLRRHVGDDELRDWIGRTRARKLSPRQARFWQVILDLPEATLREWLSDEGRQVWDRRIA